MEKVEIMKPDGIITIQLSGTFYKDLQDVLLYLTSLQEPEIITNFIEKINNESTEELNDWEKTVQTVMILCSEIETKAREQNVTEMVELPITE